MSKFALRIACALCVVAFATGAAVAAVPDEFTNLEVLPKDIGKQELLGVMKDFTAELGMRCTDCHVQKVPGDFDSFDWASDEKEEKGVARGMMRMVGELNHGLLEKATGEDDAAVSCVTCHRGLHNPRTLEQVMIRVANRDGAAAAEARYRELRERYYGSGSYDFRAGSLEGAASHLAESGDLEGARRLARLNLEMNPDVPDVRLQLAQIELAAGDQAAARTQIEAVLAKDPQNRHALRLQQQLGQ